MKSNTFQLKTTAVIVLALSFSLVNSFEFLVQRREGDSSPEITKASIIIAQDFEKTNPLLVEKSRKQPQKKEDPVVPTSLTPKQEEPTAPSLQTLRPLVPVPIVQNSCQNLPKFGSPILMFAHIQDQIIEHMRLDNQYSFVRYLYFRKTPGLTPFSIIYTMIWELSTSYSKAYVGISFDNPTYGIGTVKFQKFLYNEKLDTIKKILKITDEISGTSFTCGDQKMIFSSFGNDPRQKLPGDYPGLNYNSIPPMLLKSLQELQKSSFSAEPPSRDCDVSRFINSSNVYFRVPMLNAAPAIAMPLNKDDPLQYQNYFELSRCDPTGEPVLATLDLWCQFICCPTTTGALVGVQATFKVPFQPGKTETTPLIGTKPTSSNKISVSFTGVTRIDAFYSANGSYYALRTYNSQNNIVGAYYCGNNAQAAVEQGGVPQDSVLVKDLLGVYGGWKSDPLVAAPQFAYFGFVKHV